MAGRKPATFDDAIDRAYTTKEIQRDKESVNTKRSGDSLFKKGGKSKNKKQNKDSFRGMRGLRIGQFVRLVVSSQIELCWRTTRACLISSSMEHKMVQCLRARRDDRAPYLQPSRGQATLPAPPSRLALLAPPRKQQQQPQCQGQQRQWQRQQQPNRPQIAGMACAINKE